MDFPDHACTAGLAHGIIAPLIALAKAKKRSTKKIRATIRKQLAFIRRDTGYLENFMQDGYALTSKESTLLLTIYKLYI